MGISVSTKYGGEVIVTIAKKPLGQVGILEAPNDISLDREDMEDIDFARVEPWEYHDRPGIYRAELLYQESRTDVNVLFTPWVVRLTHAYVMVTESWVPLGGEAGEASSKV